MADPVFECGNTKCTYAIATKELNGVQLEALRRWAKTCPQCQQLTRWQEKIPLLNTQKLYKTNGGSRHARANKKHVEPDH